MLPNKLNYILITHCILYSMLYNRGNTEYFECMHWIFFRIFFTGEYGYLILRTYIKKKFNK